MPKKSEHYTKNTKTKINTRGRFSPGLGISSAEFDQRRQLFEQYFVEPAEVIGTQVVIKFPDAREAEIANSVLQMVTGMNGFRRSAQDITRQGSQFTIEPSRYRDICDSLEIMNPSVLGNGVEQNHHPLAKTEDDMPDAILLKSFIAKGATYDKQRGVVAAKIFGHIPENLIILAKNILDRNERGFMVDRARGEAAISAASFLKICDATHIDPTQASTKVFSSDEVAALRRQTGRPGRI